MEANETTFPFEIRLNFTKLITQYKERLKTETNPMVISHLKNLLGYLEEFPELESGIDSTQEAIDKYQEPISMLLADIFPQALTLNEIKVATIPLKDILFNKTERFKNILNAAGENFHPTILGLNDDNMYIMACSFILGKHYHKNIDLKRPMYYEIPDENGMIRTYKMAINADFTDIIRTEKAPKITNEDINTLLQNFENIDIWKEKFPPNSYILEGFSIINLIDVTVDTIISDVKSNLLDHTPNSTNNFNDFEANLKKLFNNIDLNVGFTLFDSGTQSLMNRVEKSTQSYMLGESEVKNCTSHFCKGAYNRLIEERKILAISDVEFYAEQSENNPLSKALLSNNIQSCIFAPIVYQDELLGILEIVSTQKNELNSINANKLEDILPYIVTTAKRSKDLAENQIKAIIQSECTSIHPTVLWKFEEEAQKFINDKITNGEGTFSDIGFDHVYPLFGQIDIKGSSTARNNAIQADFIEQLSMVQHIFEEAIKSENLPFYEQMIYRINEFTNELSNSFNTASEETLLHFLSREINPIMPHVRNLSEDLGKLVGAYENEINPDTGIIYNKRKDYEYSVQHINEAMASFLDKKQETAQDIFPHFYERYKTDGVEHNMYIGQSLTQNANFSKVYLNNLKLWQLTTMCEMENQFYAIQDSLPMALECASLLLVFSNSLSIRYRIDEKKFDVDGSYNARYEIIKKRIDKAHIKGTSERITQSGKLVIVYSQKKDELEYLRYLNFLQSKNYVNQDIELLELEDLQGVVGLKALRVSVVYNQDKQKITYDDLIKEIEK